jgi:S1-C subfamily serine protease
MKRAALYSKTRRTRAPAAPEAATPAPPPPREPSRTRRFAQKHSGALLFCAGVLLAGAAALATGLALRTEPQELTQDDIDAAVLNTLDTKSIPSRVAKAAEMVRPSIVSVRSFVDAPKDSKAKAGPGALPSQKPDENGEVQLGIGSGVVVVDNGTILTNLHVVRGAKRLVVTFFDGTESEAEFVGARPENDLAVIRAKKIPDDLQPATLGSTARLAPGDHVVAVGFPFGIGPSVSAGVVSGLDREFRSPDGDRLMTGLIQFDAAANPGNSGGPLVTLDGEVVGIVTAILNPSQQRTFIGIAFATTMEVAGNAIGIPPF